MTAARCSTALRVCVSGLAARHGYGLCCCSRGLVATEVTEGGAWSGSTGWLLQDLISWSLHGRTCNMLPAHAASANVTPKRDLCSLNVSSMHLLQCMRAPSSSVLRAVQWIIVCGLAGRAHALVLHLLRFHEKLHCSGWLGAHARWHVWHATARYRNRISSFYFAVSLARVL